jgi:hypothetical protein
LLVKYKPPVKLLNGAQSDYENNLPFELRSQAIRCFSEIQKTKGKLNNRYFQSRPQEFLNDFFPDPVLYRAGEKEVVSRIYRRITERAVRREFFGVSVDKEHCVECR